MSQYPASTVSLYNVGGEGQVGIPYAIYPSALFYKASLFKEAGLNEPPHEWNSNYTMPDGSTVPWDYDTVRKVALILTVDSNGKDATEAGFDPEKIVQWGFEPQRDDLRQVGAYWKAGTFMAADGKTVQIPEAWAAAWHYFYDGMWKDHTSVTGPQYLNTDFNPNGYPFFTGKVAMSENYLWSTYGVSDAGDDWNLAATPSYQGQTTAAFNADTFRILKDTKHPDEAFTVLQYLLANEDLLKLYAGMPAVEAKQDAFLQSLQADYKQTIDWDVAKKGVAFADVPNFESYMPAYNQTLDLLNTFTTKWQSTPGLDLDAEIADLKSQMQAIWDKGGS
jgi:multiple sugar transport system substrate-binding protein